MASPGPKFQPINKRRELTHEDARRIVHIATRSLSRWKLPTFKLVIPHVPIHEGSVIEQDSWSTDEITNWWGALMAELLEGHITTNSEPIMNTRAFNPINKPKLKHGNAFYILQHLVSQCLPKYQLQTFKSRIPDTPIHEGSIHQEDSWSKTDIIKWWQTLMVKLLNKRMAANGEPEMRTDDYLYQNGIDQRRDTLESGTSTDGNGPTLGQ